MNGSLRAPPRLRPQRALIPGCTASVTLARRYRRRVPFPRSSSGLVGHRRRRCRGAIRSVRVIRSIRIPCRSDLHGGTAAKALEYAGTTRMGFAENSRPHSRHSRPDSPPSLHGASTSHTSLNFSSQCRQREPSVQKWRVGSGGFQAPAPNGRFVPNPPTTSHQRPIRTSPPPLSRRRGGADL